MSMTEAEIFEGVGMKPPAEGEGQIADPVEVDGQGDGQEGDGHLQDPSTAEGDVPELGTDEPEGGEQQPEAAPPQNTDPQPAGTPPAQVTELQAPTTPQQGQPGGQAPAQPQPESGVLWAPPAVRGKTNPYTKQQIWTQAQYEEYLLAYQEDVAKTQRQMREDTLREAGVDPAIISAMVQELVASDPAVVAAREMAQQAQAREVEAQRKAAMDWYGEQIKKINELDPEAKLTSLEDLQARDPSAYKAMMGAVSGGASLVQAYAGVHFTRLAQLRSAAAEQRVRVQAAGKAHMAPIGAGKAGASEDVEIPEAVRRKYLELNPGMTEADIRKEYARYLKESGGSAG